jgi:hypothetical protein
MKEKRRKKRENSAWALLSERQSHPVRGIPLAY